MFPAAIRLASDEKIPCALIPRLRSTKYRGMLTFRDTSITTRPSGTPAIASVRRRLWPVPVRMVPAQALHSCQASANR